MSSLYEINNLIADYEDKISQLEKEKVKLNFIKYYNNVFMILNLKILEMD